MLYNFFRYKFRISQRSTKGIKSLIGTILKYVLIVYVSFTLLIITVLIWVYSSYLSGPNAFTLNDYHPFRSEIAKAKYLEYYDSKAKEWPLNSEVRMVSTSYGQTLVRISGPKNAPTIVLLPGGGTSSLIWKNNIVALSENFRTYALDDIYDWGRSVYTKNMGCSECVTKWLDELFAALDLHDNINLVGYSYGAWKASQYLLSYPNRLNKVVLICPAYTVYYGSKEFEKRALIGFIPLRYFMKKELYWTCEDMVQTDEGRKIADDHLEGLRLAIKCFKTKIPASMTVLTDDELKSIKVPVLYLGGENEKMYSEKEAVKRLNTIAPDFKTEVVPGTGHDLMFMYPEIVNQKILDFLNH